MPSMLVIYNPAAGRGRVQAEWAQVEHSLRDAGVDFDAVATSAPLDAMRLAREAPRKYTTVISVGGDGTLHEIVNGLLQASGEQETIMLGIIPLGNGDDFVKVLPPGTPIGAQPFDWRTAVEKIARGQTQLFDACRMLGDHLRPELGVLSVQGAAAADPPVQGAATAFPHYFINATDVGFGAHAARNFITIPRFLKGMSAYLAAIFKTMVRYPLLHLRIQLDDQAPFEQSTTMTAVANGRCFGNGFWVCPDAQANDGLFDLMVAQGIGRLTILKLIPMLMKGTHVNEPVLRMYRARRVVLDSEAPLIVEADGEIPYLETHHLELEILPRKIPIIV